MVRSETPEQQEYHRRRLQVIAEALEALLPHRPHVTAELLDQHFRGGLTVDSFVGRWMSHRFLWHKQLEEGFRPRYEPTPTDLVRLVQAGRYVDIHGSVQWVPPPDI